MNNLQTLAMEMAAAPRIQVPRPQVGGWIYILMTSANYGRYKLGMTIGNPLVRYVQLRCGDPQLAFQVAFYVPGQFGRLRQVEHSLHKRLEDNEQRIYFHDDTKSEWFKGNASDAEIDVAHELCVMTNSAIANYRRDYLYGNDRMVRAMESDLESHYGRLPPFNEETGLPLNW